MAFRVVLVEHGYASTAVERSIIEAAGGEFIDADAQPLDKALTIASQADAVMFRRITFTREMMNGLRRCKILMRYGIGTDNVDVEAATDAGIIVGHVPDYCFDEVSTHAIGLLLACVRKILPTDARMRTGGWDVHRNDPIHRLAGRTLGLVGFGNIGRAVARKLADWNIKLIATDPYATAALGVERVSFEDLLKRSDFVSLHCPLLPETRHLMSEPQFAMMKSGAILINTARGPVVDAAALIKALDSGKISQAALDVFEDEPLPVDSPLRRHPKIILTDHTAWYSEESQQQLQKSAAEEVVRVCTGGLPRSLMNPLVLKKLKRWSEWTPPENVRWQLKRLKIPKEHAARVP